MHHTYKLVPSVSLEGIYVKTCQHWPSVWGNKTSKASIMEATSHIQLGTALSLWYRLCPPGLDYLCEEMCIYVVFSRRMVSKRGLVWCCKVFLEICRRLLREEATLSHCQEG